MKSFDGEGSTYALNTRPRSGVWEWPGSDALLRGIVGLSQDFAHHSCGSSEQRSVGGSTAVANYPEQVTKRKVAAVQDILLKSAI
jgi:hypothetical protein